MAQMQAGRGTRLVLHFDLNNTILMADKAKGLNVHLNVSSNFPSHYFLYRLTA